MPGRQFVLSAVAIEVELVSVGFAGYQTRLARATAQMSFNLAALTRG